MAEQIEIRRDIEQLRNDVVALKDVVDTLSLLLNKRLLKELLDEEQQIRSGDFITEEEFFMKHHR